MSSLEGILHSRFGFHAFRPGQRELIGAVLAGRDALGVLPTGGGKSLCYQLPALALQGLTLVVSPLIALMKDQVDAFNRRGSARAVAIHSGQTAAESFEAMGLVHRGGAALLYVAPERLESPEFRLRLQALEPRLLVIDEAHCVSLWGHDFRPSYLCLDAVAEALRPCPVLALTATATPATRTDIIGRLRLRDPLVHVAPFDRPNLRFEVHPCGPDEKLRRLRRILRELDGSGSQIVYVGRRKDADDIAASLERDGLGAVAYHAGMDAGDRRDAQEDWLAGKKPIAVATIAFGMGIDKADVRAVIHYQHPASLESYYQEIGRAGRDGRPARCALLFNAKDRMLAHFFLRNRYPSREDVLALARAVPLEGISPEDLREARPQGLTDEQANVGLQALLEEGWLLREDRGLIRRQVADPAAAFLQLDGMFARKRSDYDRLEAMISYGNETACHRAVLLGYFGETIPDGHRCGNCSACSGGTSGTGRDAAADEVDRVLRLHGTLLSRTGPLSPTSFARFLAGSRSKKIPGPWHTVPEFGILSHLGVKDLRGLAEAAILRARAKKGRPASTRRRPGIDENTAPDNAPDGAPGGAPGDGDAFWRSPHREFTRAQLEARQVDRRRGLMILELLSGSAGGLAPSRIVNILRRGDPEAWPDGPAEPSAGGQSLLSAIGYDDLLADVLAMWAKGYLAPASAERGGSRRLVLAAPGRSVLQARRG